MKVAKITIILYFVTLFLSFSAYSGVNYIDSPPLNQVVKGAIVDCSDSAVQVPLITWGGDIATIYANGNNKNTAKESIFAKQGLNNISLVREDVFSNQINNYLSCKTPYLRGTMGMINMAAELLNKDPRTKPIVIYQLTWSAGGDAMVVKENIKTPADLKNKTIALQAYGPHVDYLSKILSDAGLSIKDVTIKWVNELTGKRDSPMAAFYEPTVDAAMVIIPDALALTVGTGAEDSVKGASVLLSTKTANRIIADVYAVRADYLKANQQSVERFVNALMVAEEELSELFKNRKAKADEYKKMITAAAEILLDSPQAVLDAEGLYKDCEYVGFRGNVMFFTDKNYPRNFNRLVDEIQMAFVSVGLLSKQVTLESANWDYNNLKANLKNTEGVELAKFDKDKVATVITQKQKQGREEEGVLFSFEVYFQSNQNDFPAEMYKDAFKKVINLASTYGGAIITVEGHSDPLGYLKKKKSDASQIVLNSTRQAAKNLSLSRANAVRNSVIEHAKSQGTVLDPTQFTVIGHGIDKPKSGMCGVDPCPPKTKQEWLNNMRVEFKIIQIEAENIEFERLE
ncbi:MAG: ABC transporter substrate-binding protein [Candidatus Magnetoovum sp. WYHC-5]|nr:ABC transporter substrate-binding protein [Candidatus Magnetoovum sp. WYHC-5]